MRAKYDIKSFIYETEDKCNISLIYGETDYIEVESTL